MRLPNHKEILFAITYFLVLFVFFYRSDSESLTFAYRILAVFLFLTSTIYLFITDQVD
jgi:hypothetical protein